MQVTGVPHPYSLIGNAAGTLAAHLRELAFDGHSEHDGNEPAKRDTEVSLATAPFLPHHVRSAGPGVHNGHATLENPGEACFPLALPKSRWDWYPLEPPP